MNKYFSLKLKIDIEIVKKRIPIKNGYQNKFKYFLVNIKDRYSEMGFNTKSMEEICHQIKNKLRGVR